jgi:23S rRNA (uracil1939-C5)-methyltransferase
LQLSIEKLVYGGDGLARLPADEHGPGKAVFVPFTLRGEQIEASLVEQKPGFARARAENILAASPDRVTPHCPYFQRCGGCHYQHATYERQLAIKAEIFKENLRRFAKLELAVELKTLPSPPWNYRNRTRLQVRNHPQFAAGYYELNSHDLLPIENCPISSPLINRAITQLWALGREGRVPTPIHQIEFFADAEDRRLLMAIFVPPDESSNLKRARKTGPEAGLWQELPGALGRNIPELATVSVLAQPVNRQTTEPATQEPVCLLGSGHLNYRTRYACYRVSAGSFFQTNRHLTDELITVVTQGQAGDTGLDLYAGVGLFSSVLAGAFDHIVAVEPSQLSFADLQYNSPANVKAVRATTEQFLKTAAKSPRPGLIVVDPPRHGLGDRVTHGLVELGSPRLTYVSCDPVTLARDLRNLLAAGYRIEQAHLVDLFPQTYHVESVLRLVR